MAGFAGGGVGETGGRKTIWVGVITLSKPGGGVTGDGKTNSGNVVGVGEPVRVAEGLAEGVTMIDVP